ncbi:von Willebrand factor A domain-containing protein 7-like [Syngnathoides biaculeatus]|uniref:von Willebrand factor A domain-containing protein 7-like n=1 Tax=Syngnathoides biaculeatus TaxID=300417 RepID=UPI002ADE41FA|nr:von Willebrand factor A domain-containing protein 7-like [Syngnathoides biaculeatus]
MSPALGILGLLLLRSGAEGFGILPGSSQDHLEITEEAILNVTVQACRALAEAEGNDFSPPPQPFTITAVAVACRSENSKRFQQAITSIISRNVRVDLVQALNASFHFDDESFVGGRDIITSGLRTVKANNVQQNFEAAQEILGMILHPLQDFYSHSNWVEIGNEFPNSNLIRSDTSIGNIADVTRATCRSCDGDDCSNNILEDIIQEQILTSGYFGIIPFVSTKPSGKCSHGGALDLTSIIEPTGGINKDTFDSEHGFLHTRAANLAVSATSEILENVRQATGDVPFLQMLGISRGSGKALCFVIDTTQSMSDDIAAVQNATSSFISSQVGTPNEPLSYILVPFNDPEFGPLMRTTDPQLFMDSIDDLSASGGGDEGELSLSGLQLALSNAPQSSDIFLFTDAPAKDRELKSTVIALIERTQSVVYFLITGTGENSRRRRRNRVRSGLQQHKRIASGDIQLYQDVALAAGGLVIELENDELLEATRIIGQMSNSSMVTLLQASRTPGQDPETFTFAVDQTSNNVRLLITGRPDLISLTNPRGITRIVNGMGIDVLISSSEMVGNLQTLALRTEDAGTWRVQVEATAPYTLRATSQSPLDFLFDFVEYIPSKNTFDVLDSRPAANTNGTLLVTLTGSDTANVTMVTLVEAASSVEVEGVVEPQGRGNFLVRFDTIPSLPFVVLVEGTVTNASGESISFRRLSETTSRGSNLTIRAEAELNFVPGMVLSVPFFLNTERTGGNVSIRVTTNNPLYTVSAPSSLLVEPGVTANGTVTLSVPLNTPSGTTVTLVIEAEGTGDLGINYIVLRISVLNPVSDFTSPVCEVVCIVNCVHNCSTTSWELSLRVSDGTGGTGVERVSLVQGNGTLDLRRAPDDGDVVLATYNASCASPDAELVAVDRVGNVATCAFNAFDTSSGGVASSRTRTPLSHVALALALGVLLSLNVC